MDHLAVANFVVSTITAVCALYLSFVALGHAAKPRGQVKLIGPRSMVTSAETEVCFEFKNLGHWYAKPPIVDLDAWVNFHPSFDLTRIRYGSALEIEGANVRVGKGGLKYLKAKGLKLGYGGGVEPVAVRVRCPEKPGRYLVKVDAFSENGANIKGRWKIRVRSTKK